MTVRARVFSKDGNRFLVPGFWCNEDDEDWRGMSVSSILCEGMMLGVVCGLDSHQEWMDLETREDGTAELTWVPYEMIGRVFAHGGTRVMLIGGPLFDEAVAKIESQVTGGPRAGGRDDVGGRRLRLLPVAAGQSAAWHCGGRCDPVRGGRGWVHHLVGSHIGGRDEYE